MPAAVQAQLHLRPDIARVVVTVPAVEAVIRKDAEAIKDGARSLAPVRTGAYRDSIAAAVEHSSTGPTGRITASAPYAVFLEFGTNDTPTFAPITRAAAQVS